jgi:DNA-binding NarL/FixJ family response regulator
MSQSVTHRESEQDALCLTRILVVEDHAMMRQAIRDLLEEEPDVAVCGEAADAAAAMELLDSSHPHLVILDVSLGHSNGLDLIEPMLRADPAVRILVLSMHDASLYAERALRAGARGYVNKRNADTLPEAIRDVLSGRIHVGVNRNDILGRLDRPECL